MGASFLGTVPGTGDLHQRPTKEIINAVVAVPRGRLVLPLRSARLFGAVGPPQDGKTNVSEGAEGNIVRFSLRCSWEEACLGPRMARVEAGQHRRHRADGYKHD